jgi:hypothetical protein
LLNEVPPLPDDRVGCGGDPLSLGDHSAIVFVAVLAPVIADSG